MASTYATRPPSSVSSFCLFTVGDFNGEALHKSPTIKDRKYHLNLQHGPKQKHEPLKWHEPNVTRTSYYSVADARACVCPACESREPVKITGGSGPDPLAREVGAAKVKDMHRDAVRRAFVPPEKELPVGRERLRLPDTSSMGLQSKRDKAGSSRQTRKNGVEVDDDDDADDGQQPWVVLVAEDQLFTIEAKREELKGSRFARVEACCKVCTKNG